MKTVTLTKRKEENDAETHIKAVLEDLKEKRVKIWTENSLQ